MAVRAADCRSRAGYNCQQPRTRRCLFLHGVGTTGNGQFLSYNTPGDCSPRCKYWGSMETELAGICSTFEYAYFNTNQVCCADYDDP